MSRVAFPFLLMFAALGHAQPAGRLTFEAAAIKPSGVDDSSSSTHSGNDRLSIENLSLKQLIQFAYDVQDYAYSGPAWLEGERYNLQAKAEAKATREQFGEMLQNLLADRCKLVVHRESKQMSGYALVIAKGGLKIQPVEGKGSSVNTDNSKLTVKHADMARIASWAGRQLRQPVVDETGVKDSFDFEIEYANPRRERSDSDAPTLPSLFTAFTERLGLKLEARKVSVEVLVVDKMERPSEN